jgi:DhnA family fructose-bisphosphate aldolase class Ia
MTTNLKSLLGDEASYLLDYQAKVSKDLLHLPSPDWINRIFVNSDRSPQVLRSLQQLYGHGRLANTGYLSILPVDQGIEHSAGASFAPNPIYFDPENIEADIIKQKLPENNGGYNVIGEISSYGKTDQRIYSELTTEHPIDLTRYQVLNCYCGRASLINSGGTSGENDLGEAVRTAVINKRAGGAGLISGRKTFQKSFEEGVRLFHAIQDVYLSEDVAIA